VTAAQKLVEVPRSGTNTRISTLMKVPEARLWVWVLRRDWRHRAQRRIAAAGLDLSPLRGMRARPGAVWAVGIVRDEADIIRATVTNFLEQGVERVVVADNGSTDGTADLVRDITGVTVVEDRSRAFYQGDKLTLLARAAARAGAEWVVPFDADELWTAPGGLARFLASSGADVVRAEVWNYVPSTSDPDAEPDPTRRLRRRQSEPATDPKWAFRAHRLAAVDEGNFRVFRTGSTADGLCIAHFPYRSEEQLLKKFRAGKEALDGTTLDQRVGYQWRTMGARPEAQLRAEWRALLEDGVPLSVDAWAVDGETVLDPYPEFRDRLRARPRILVVTKLSPEAPSSGSVIRLRHTVAGLAGAGDVDCLQWNPTPWRRRGRHRISDVDWGGPRPESRLVRASGSGVPSRLTGWYAAAWVAAAKTASPRRVLPLEIARSGRPRGRTMRRLARMAESYDLLWFFKLDPAIALQPLFDRAAKAVVDLDDLLHISMDEPQHDDALTTLDRAAWLARYRYVAQRADVLTAANPDEASHLGSRVVVIPNGATLTDDRTARPIGSPPVLAFVALMKYEPNRDAADWLATEIVPELTSVIGDDFEVRLIGEATPGIRALASRHVTVTGYVEDLDAELARCDLAIVPLRAGTGTRLKILEAFSRGLPVVSTRIGAAGLDVVDGEQLLLADTPTDFARACARVLQDPDLRQKLTTNARQLVVSRYDWRSIEASISALASDVLDQDGRPRLGARDVG
jgi:glycosyltransferase involved in cell wall biosynthesis